MKCDELQYERLGDANKTYPASTLVIRKQFVDAAIAELKAKLEDVQATAYAESVDAGMENCRLKRALWLARAERAHLKVLEYWPDYCHNAHCRIYEQKWDKVERKCRAMAEKFGG
jgi:hypothetical protein